MRTFRMPLNLLGCVALTVTVSPSAAQEIVKVRPNHSRAVARPDDLFALPSGQWHVVSQLSQGQGPCAPEQCEAGFNSGEMVVSVEHSGEFVRVIAGFRGCDAVGSSEVEVGKKPGKPTFGRVRDQMKRVVKAVAKTCKVTAPNVPALDASQLFPTKQRA